jgi:heptaprenyl diphosphate synthase
LKLYPFPAEAIKQKMREALYTTNPEINQVLDYLLETSGKMLRPRLVYLTASFFPNNSEVVQDVAVAVELIHLASLVHDDVIDHSNLRRGQPSLNSQWGNHISVLCGDYLFATAFKLINKHNIPAVLENVTDTIRIMCAGEIQQLSMLGNVEISEEEYIYKCFCKTACLFASSCKIGALTSTCLIPEVHISNLEQYGACLGYAYQIIDDVLDFTSASHLLGKPVGSDLLQGNITLPVILVLKDKEYGLWLRKLLQGGSLKNDMIPVVTEILMKTGAIDESIKRSKAFLQQGLQNLDRLPAGPAKEELKNLTICLMEDYYSKLNQDHVGNRRPQSGNIC